MKEKFRRFMIGRYGSDDLTKCMTGAVLVVWVINLFAQSTLLYYSGIVLLVWAYFRMFSRNIQKRYQENMKYLELKNKVIQKVRNEKSHMQQRKTHHIYKCPTCKQKIRIPRGKGRICITCPKCKTEFTKTS